MSMRNSPSCICCETTPPCVVLLSSDADYLTSFSALSGSWSSGTTGGHGYWEVSIAPAAISTTVATDSGVPYRLTALFNFAPTAGTGASWRLAAGGSDASNYTFVEFRILFSAGEYYGQLLIGQVVAGVDTYFASAPYSSTGDMLVHGAASYEMYLGVEWDTEGALTGWIGDITAGFTSRTITKRSVTPNGGFAGLFVTALSGTLRMKQFYLEHGYDAADTPMCNRTFQSCAKGVPVDLTIRFSDSSPLPNKWCAETTFICLSEGDISPSCSDALGTYAVPHAGDGDDHCLWVSEWVIIKTADCTRLGIGTVSVDFELQVSVQVVYTSDITGAERRITVTLAGRSGLSGTCSLGSFQLTTTSPIETLTSYTTIPRVADSSLCSSSTITCELKV